jgi:site-specific recombinase XerD
MALEEIYKSPRTLAKLRSGPLKEFVEGFCHWLQLRGHTCGVIRAHLSSLSHFNEHLGGAIALPKALITEKEVEDFLKAYRSKLRNRGSMKKHNCRVCYSINRFTDYVREKGLFDPLSHSLVYQPILDAYLEWMCLYQHAADGTLKVRAHSITQFLHWLGAQATEQGLQTLRPEQIEAFFVSYAQEMGRSSRRSMQSALRTFLRFCLHKGYVSHALDMAVPTLRTYKLSTVPHGLSEEQMQQVLQSVDRCTDVGKRDYAILQLLYSYGVRGGQVRALRLEDINWGKDQILFRASKNGKDTLLPLTPEVGQSLLDYLQKGRPSLCVPQVFLTSRAPYHPLPYSSSLSAIVERRIQATGIDVPSKGAHAFRHGFATRMLRQGHELKSIADVLGHRHLGTTFIYTKVNFNELKQVALDWPEEV